MILPQTLHREFLPSTKFKVFHGLKLLQEFGIWDHEAILLSTYLLEVLVIRCGDFFHQPLHQNRYHKSVLWMYWYILSFHTVEPMYCKGRHLWEVWWVLSSPPKYEMNCLKEQSNCVALKLKPHAHTQRFPHDTVEVDDTQLLPGLFTHETH